MENDSIQRFLSRLQPHCRELFRMAHAITGNAELAEFALASAMRAAYLEMGKDVSFREGIRRAVVGEALAQLPRLNPDEYPQDFVCYALTDDADEAGTWLAGEKAETRRLLFLRYGCGLGSSDAGRVMGISRQAARRALADAQANFDRALSHMSFERTMARAARQEMARADAGIPDMGTLFRTFEAEVRSAQIPRFSARKIVRAVVCTLCALILAAMFWLFAAITSAPEPESAPISQTEVVYELT